MVSKHGYAHVAIPKRLGELIEEYKVNTGVYRSVSEYIIERARTGLFTDMVQPTQEEVSKAVQ